MHQDLIVSCARNRSPSSAAAQAAAVVEQSMKMGFAGEIWPVHPEQGRGRRRKAYRSVADLPGAPDAAFVGVNRI